MALHLLARTGHPDFLDLPWDLPLAEWEHPRLEEIPAGLHRHVVRFVRYDHRLYVLKELPRRYAEREYRFMNYLKEQDVPTVEAVGVATERRAPDGEPLESVIITKHLAYSLPYRLLFSRRSSPSLVDSMLDALAHLLVRVHLVGFMWGDCSLSNTLFRRDARELAAYLIDTETGELHPSLTRGQRLYDLELAMERTAGELLDLSAQGLVPDGLDPSEFGLSLEARYHDLWGALTDVERFATRDRHRIAERLQRVNQLGYDVGEVQLHAVDGDDTQELELTLRDVEAARFTRLLRDWTGLHAGERQARFLLEDIESYGRWLESIGQPLHRDRLGRRWYQDSYLAVLDRVPEELWGRREGPQLFAEVIDHWRWIMGERGVDLPLMEGADDYVANVLTPAEVEEVVATEDAFTTDSPLSDIS